MPTRHPRPWHRRSVFGDGPRRPLDRDQRARFKFLTRAHARAGRLPAKQGWVATALLKRLGVDGRCDPSHDTLAADAGCDPRTVRRALATLRRLGLVLWVTRLVRDGWRAAQTSNAYELNPNAAPPAVCCDGQSGRETRKQDIKLISARSQRAMSHPSEGTDEWARWNAARQIELLAG